MRRIFIALDIIGDHADWPNETINGEFQNMTLDHDNLRMFDSLDELVADEITPEAQQSLKDGERADREREKMEDLFFACEPVTDLDGNGVNIDLRGGPYPEGVVIALVQKGKVWTQITDDKGRIQYAHGWHKVNAMAYYECRKSLDQVLDERVAEAEKIMKQRAGVDFSDLGLDAARDVRRHLEDGTEPLEWVEWYMEKYDLLDLSRE
jgi:hypothetical protein